MYKVYLDTSPDNIGSLIFESNNFIEALKQAKILAIQKVNRVYVYSDVINSDVCIIYDPMGKETIL